MSQQVFFAVLIAAFMHAAWNALIKTDLDRFLSISLMGVSQGAIALALLAFVPVPTGVTWVWILASAALHTGYKLFLVRAYQAGDLSQVYPLARGSAPLITALAGYFLIGEALGPFVAAGIVTLCLGIALMSFKGGNPLARLDRSAVIYALITSVFIAGYTLTDGVGARGAATPASYILWMFLFDGLTIAVVYRAVRGRGAFSAMARSWKVGVPSAALSLGAYWIVIWAMTKAPIAAVAALRETSILFALAISVLFLKERPTLWRVGAAALIITGVAALRAA